MSSGQPGPSILISCGEPSGDVYAAAVANALRELLPGVRLAGVGGEQLASAGVPLWATLDQLSVMGFAEVIRHLPRLWRLRDVLAARAVREGVRLLVAVDYPGFHVALAGRLARHGIATLDVIPPKTWSWGAWRLRSLRRSVASCAVIFPFEEAYYRAHGIDARYVGHPLLDRYAAELAAPAPARRGLLLCPGSRRQELLRVGPALGEAAASLLATGTTDRVAVSLALGVDAAWLAPLRARCPQAEVVQGPLLPLLRRAQAAIVTSGTATLEAALARTPHAIVYRTSAASYAIARALATVEHIGIVNLVLGRRAIPELLQGRLSAAPLTRAVAPLLDAASPQALAQQQAFDELRSILGGGGAARRVAAMAMEMLAGRLRPREDERPPALPLPQERL